MAVRIIPRRAQTQVQSEAVVISESEVAAATGTSSSVGGTPAPDQTVSFNGYADIAAMDADTDLWAGYEATDGGGLVELDDTVTYGAASKSLKYGWFRGAGEACTTKTNTRQFHLTSRHQEVWLEFPVRYSSNFTTTADPFDPGTCNAAAGDHKTIFAITEDGNTGRWEIKIGAQGGIVLRAAGTNSAENDERYTGLSASTYWDEQWHIVRLHFRHSTGNATGDGDMEAWIDGVKIFDQVSEYGALNTTTDDGTTDRIVDVRLGSTQQKGKEGEWMYMWWGPVKVWWSQDPGW